ncbi:MAG: Spy/CpxP family protein refolding chaperone [Stellaceae bacterium]
MPIVSLRRTAFFAATSLLVSTLAFAQTPNAAELHMAQAAPQPAAKPAPTSYVEARIKSLHDELKITAAEEPKWNAVADAMRDNAQSVGALINERAKKAKAMNAVDNLSSYQAIAKAHLDGIEKLLPAFKALYADMPAAQKKTADTVFNRRPQRPSHAPRTQPG